MHLYSFSKVFCLTGYRVGAIAAGPRLNAEIAKAMDTVAICAPRIGQAAALEGLRSLGEWRRGNTSLMRDRLAALRSPSSATTWAISRSAPVLTSPISAIRTEIFPRPRWRGSWRISRTCSACPAACSGGQEEFLRFAFANVPADSMPAIAERLAQDARP